MVSCIIEDLFYWCLGDSESVESNKKFAAALAFMEANIMIPLLNIPMR